MFNFRVRMRGFAPEGVQRRTAAARDGQEFAATEIANSQGARRLNHPSDFGTIVQMPLGHGTNRSRMRWFLAGVATTVLLIAFASWAYIASGSMPVNADATPSPIERWVARTAVIASVRRQSEHGKSPESPAASEADLLEGIHVYMQRCEACHGDASGTPSAIARGLYQHPPQFAKKGTEDLPYGYATWVIQHGIRLNPVSLTNHGGSSVRCVPRSR